MQIFSVALPVHHFLDPVGSHIFNRLKLGTRVAAFNLNFVFIQLDLFLINMKCGCEQTRLVLFLCKFVFAACIRIFGL